MAFQPVNATAMVELIYLCDGQRCENTLYFRHASTDWTEAELLALATGVTGWWNNEMANLTSIDVELVGVDATSLATQFSPKVITVLSPVSPGFNNTPVLPNNATFCTTFTTALRGRGFRGRNYFVGLGEAVVTKSTVLTGWASSLRGAYNTLIGTSTYLPAGVSWVVVTRVVNKVIQMPSALTNFVISANHADLIVDSQRRRLPGKGT